MRILGLVILGLSVSFVGCNPPAAEPTAPVTPPATGDVDATSGSTNAAIPSMNKSVKLVKMKVSMHCPHGCYPAVKEALESEAGVEGVTLAEQKDKDTIDNPYVYVATTGNFDAAAAVKGLEKAGFESEVVTN